MVQQDARKGHKNKENEKIKRKNILFKTLTTLRRKGEAGVFRSQNSISHDFPQGAKNILLNMF